MNAGRRIVLALGGILVLVLIVYYGFFTADENLPEMAVHDPAGDQLVPPTELDSQATARDRWSDSDPDNVEEERWAVPADPELDPTPMIAMGQDEPAGVTPTHSAATPGYLTAPTWRDVPDVNPAEDDGDGGKDTPLPARRDRSFGASPNIADGPAGEDRETLETTADHPAVEPNPSLSNGRPVLQTNRPTEVAIPPAPVYGTYVVRSGDTMSSIAADWFGDERKWDLIAQANPLVDPLRLQIGQKLRLPPKDAPRESTRVLAGSGGDYTVGPGDTLSAIARQHYGDESRWRRIYEANRRAIGPNPDTLKVGTVLFTNS